MSPRSWIVAGLAVATLMTSCAEGGDGGDDALGMRFHSMAARRSTAGTEEVSSALQVSPKNPGEIHFNGGIDDAVMANPIKVFLIYYGNWTVPSTRTNLIESFVNSLTGSKWWNINTVYGNLMSKTASRSISFAGHIHDNYSQGAPPPGGIVTVTQSQMVNIVNLSKKTFGFDINAIYVVMGSADVNQQQDDGEAFCAPFCAWHAGVGTVGQMTKIAFVGDGSTLCFDGCINQAPVSPNGDAAADSQIDSLAHELAESAVDPELTGWFMTTDSGAFVEGADICDHNFGPTFTAPNGATANLKLGSKNFLVQRNWLQFGDGFCSNGYARSNDVIWQKSGGQIVVQQMKNTTTPSATGPDIAPASGQTYLGAGDFDGDGGFDILLRNGSTITTWTMSGTSRTSTQTLGTTSAQFLGIADYDGDGRQDIFWSNAYSNSVTIWQMATPGITLGTITKKSPWTDRNAIAVGDFDGDGKADILWRKTDGSNLTGFQMTVQGVGFGPATNGVVGGVGNISTTNTGQDSIVLRESDGTVVSLLYDSLQGKGIKTTLGTSSSAILGVGDLDGNGRPEIVFVNHVVWPGAGQSNSTLTGSPSTGVLRGLGSDVTF
jgi:hypothetical protein